MFQPNATHKAIQRHLNSLSDSQLTLLIQSAKDQDNMNDGEDEIAMVLLADAIAEAKDRTGYDKLYDLYTDSASRRAKNAA